MKSVDKNQNFILSNTEKQKWYHANLLPSWRLHYKSFIKVMVLSGTFLLLTFLLAERPKVKTKHPIFSFCNK